LIQTSLQCVMLKIADTLMSQGVEIDPELFQLLRLRGNLHKNPFPEYAPLLRYPIREYEYLCKYCRGVCQSPSVVKCGVTGYSTPCHPQKVFMFNQTHAETGGVSEVRVLESDIYGSFPDKKREEAIDFFCKLYSAFRVKAVMCSEYGIKWVPYSEHYFDDCILEEMI